MKKRTRRILFFYLPIFVMLGVFGYYGLRHLASQNPSSSGQPSLLNLVFVQPEELQPLSSVENQLKVDVEVDRLTQYEVVFRVTMESYQNVEAVRADLLKTSFLTVDQTSPISPSAWEDIRQDDFKKEGYLTFKLPQKPSVMRLSIFEMVERTFEWDLATTPARAVASSNPLEAVATPSM